MRKPNWTSSNGLWQISKATYKTDWVGYIKHIVKKKGHVRIYKRYAKVYKYVQHNDGRIRIIENGLFTIIPEYVLKAVRKLWAEQQKD